MRKIINLALNKYAPIPLSLREDSSKSEPASEIEVDPAPLACAVDTTHTARGPTSNPPTQPGGFFFAVIALKCRQLRQILADQPPDLYVALITALRPDNSANVFCFSSQA